MILIRLSTLPLPNPPQFRYNNLNSGVVNRGKMLHAAVHNLQSFDRTMDQVTVNPLLSLTIMMTNGNDRATRRSSVDTQLINLMGDMIIEGGVKVM